MNTYSLIPENAKNKKEVLSETLLPNFEVIKSTDNHHHIHDGLGSCTKCSCPAWVQNPDGWLCDRCGHWDYEHK